MSTGTDIPARTISLSQHHLNFQIHRHLHPPAGAGRRAAFSANDTPATAQMTTHRAKLYPPAVRRNSTSQRSAVVHFVATPLTHIDQNGGPRLHRPKVRGGVVSIASIFICTD